MTNPPIAAAKAALRKAARATRAAAAADGGATHFVTELIVALARARGAAAVSGYWSIGEEIDVRPALTALLYAGVTVSLPVMGEKAAPLTFREWRPDAAVDHRVWGIYEPRAEAPEVRPDLVLVPLLAFDDTGARLGYGGGYYDRTLALLRADGGPAILACGIAFAAQEVAQVPCEPYDMRLDAVITEAGLRTFAPEPGRKD